MPGTVQMTSTQFMHYFKEDLGIGIKPRDEGDF